MATAAVVVVVAMIVVATTEVATMIGKFGFPTVKHHLVDQIGILRDFHLRAVAATEEVVEVRCN